MGLNKPVDFTTANLLKEKGFNELCSSYYIKSDIEPIETNVKCSNNRIADSCYTAPTIAEVIMWLYKKHGIWIEVLLSEHHPYSEFYYRASKVGQYFLLSTNGEYSKNPTEAYEAAIQYCLNNLIN